MNPQNNTPPVPQNGFMNALNYSRQNPSSPFANEFRNRIQSGQLNDDAKAAGVDISRFVTAPPPPPKPTEPSIQKVASDFGSGVSSAFKNAQESETTVLADAATGKQGGATIGNVILNSLGVGAKLGTDIIGSGIKSLWDAVKTPQDEAIIKNFAQHVLDTPLGQQGIAAAKLGTDAYNSFKQKNPDFAKNLESVVNIGSFIATATPIVSGVNKAVQAGKEILPEAMQGAKNLATGAKETITGVKNAVVSTPEENAWKIVQPNLTTTEQAAARKVAGQVTENGVLKTTTLNPVGRNAEMLKVSTPYLADVKTAGEAIPKLQEGLAQEAINLRTGLNQSNAIWNKNELKGVINAVEKPHQLSGDLEKSFQKTLDVVLDQSKTADKKLTGLLDVRQNFDAIVEKQYPNLYNTDTMTAVKKAVMDTRSAINDLIESKLPDGVTADGTAFKDSLRKQSLLYDAIDNAATNAAKTSKVGTNVVTRAASAIKKHPIITTVGAIGAGYEAGKHLGL